MFSIIHDRHNQFLVELKYKNTINTLAANQYSAFCSSNKEVAKRNPFVLKNQFKFVTLSSEGKIKV